MADALNCTDYFTQNSDISGIGVRVSFYMQVLLLPLAASLSAEAAASAFWALVSICLGLIVAAIVSWSQDALSFYNADIVANLLWMANNALVPVFLYNNKEFRKRKSHSYLIDAIYIINSILTYVALFYMWGRAYSFGPDSECTPSIKIFFSFWKVSISFKRIRVIALVFYVFNAACLIYLLGFRRSLVVQREALAQAGPNASRYFEYWLKQRTLKKVAYTIIPTGLLVIAPIEKFLRQDPQPASGDAQWSFGQILSLVAAIPSVVSALTALATFLGEDESLENLEKKAVPEWRAMGVASWSV